MSDAGTVRRATPWLLSAPALALFAVILLVPLMLTAVLSFNVFNGMRGIEPAFTLANYAEILTDAYYREIFVRTGLMALGVTALTALLGVPETLILARMKAPWRGVFLIVILGPLLISVVVRTLGWSILLGNQGVINSGLQWLGVVHEPVRFLFSMLGVVIAMTHVSLPFMVIAVWSALQKLDPQVDHAARSLGARPFTSFFKVVFPQLLPGVLSGCIIVFALAASSFATPSIMGGRRVKVIATATYDEFLNSLNWPLGAALAMLLFVAMIVIIVGSNRLIERRFKQVFAA